MGWVDIVSVYYNGSGNYVNSLYVTIQYKSESVTTTSIELRGKAGVNDSKDAYFLWTSDGGTSRLLSLDKTSSYTSNSFTVTKGAWTNYFSIPELWICNDGSHRDPSAYTDYNGRGFSAYNGGNRKNYRTIIPARTIYTSVYITGNSAGGVPTITDNGNNTFSITGNAGTNGNYNSITETKLQYAFNDDAWITASSNSLPATSLTAAASAKNQKIWARTRYKCQYGGDSNGYIYSGNTITYIPNYQAPSSPSNLRMLYNKNRLTIKEDWRITWDESTPTNDSSPVYGYRIRLFKKSPTDVDFKSIPIIDDNEVQLSVGNVQSDGTVYYHLDIGTDTQYTINPASCNLAAKDMFKFSIQPYTKYGTGTLLLGTEVSSNISYSIQNAGIVRIIDTNGKGQEGNVWIKVSNTEWKEAETVNYKISNTEWRESQ